MMLMLLNKLWNQNLKRLSVIMKEELRDHVGLHCAN